MGHLLMQNRNGLVVDTEATHAPPSARRRRPWLALDFDRSPKFFLRHISFV